MRLAPLALILLLAACGGGRDAPEVPSRLYPGETAQMRRLIERAADDLDIPEALLHRVIQRESDPFALQIIHECHDQFWHHHGRAFGDFEDQPLSNGRVRRQPTPQYLVPTRIAHRPG